MTITGEYVPSPSDWVRKQVDTIEETGTTESVDIQGRPVVLLTMNGVTGSVRKVPLMRVEHDGLYAAVASKGGAPEHPTWFHNLVANPRVELQDGPERQDYDARLVTGDERARWWQRAVATWPAYDDYQAKTDREIPVFVLTPVAD